MEKTKKPYKNSFSKVVIQKCEKSKKKIISKNCLTLFVSGREKNAHFRAHYLFWPKCFFWTKTVQSKKHYKIGVSAEIAKKAKMTPFFGKRCFLTWLKKWVLLTVFLKSCVSWKHYFYIVFSKTQLFKNKNCMLNKNRKFMKNSGLLLNMAKWSFLGWFFEVLIFKGLFLVCLALFQKC